MNPSASGTPFYMNLGFFAETRRRRWPSPLRCTDWRPVGSHSCRRLLDPVFSRGVTVPSFYDDHDPREVPLYSVGEASRYLHIPSATLRSWVVGRAYSTQGGESFFEPLLRLPDVDAGRLSFSNLVEAHVLRARAPNMVFLSARFGLHSPMRKRSFKSKGCSSAKSYGRRQGICSSRGTGSCSISLSPDSSR